MSVLAIYNENGGEPVSVTKNFEEISTALDGIGVRFEKWEANQAIATDTPSEEILAAYRESIDKLGSIARFESMDVVSIHPDHPDREAMRSKFLAEHTHSDFEVRFFVDGDGLFYLHTDGKVHVVLCEKGDLISVPADTAHWFDMGSKPSFKCIRLFTIADGWVASMTGSEISKQFPDYDQFVAGHR